MTTHELALAQRERAAAENASATAQQRAAELEPQQINAALDIAFQGLR